MTTPAVHAALTPLEAVLFDVDAVLADLLVAADEQHAAVVAGDRERLEYVTRLQEGLASRLERFEAKRLSLLAGQSLAAASGEMPAAQAERVGNLSRSIADAVRELQPRHARNGSLLQRSAELAGQTVLFLQRVASPPSSSYGAHGRRAPQQSLLVDRRA
ncbi:MAG TPA: flagellar export chaperone FlgN [Chloroflexota bacterium]|nr:flagellar export chaperone FlgN [Chloroflexota bacterium]